MLTLIDEATIAEYGTYGKPDAPLMYERGAHAGKPVEFVVITVPGADPDEGRETRTLTLNPAINGERPELGAKVAVVARVQPGRAEGLLKRDLQTGELFEVQRTKDKWRAEAFRTLNGKS
jgi:hypothetical protein